ncbi:unnamed protein product, partial [Durusdinium trenchii]
QVFLLVEINSVLCNPAVRGIREVYSTYQKAIYGDNVYQTVNGFWRGNEGADMNEQGFLDLSKDMQFKVCNVSLSQPYYTLVILLVWTFTCLAEIRVSLMMARNLLWHTPVVEHVTECMERTEDNCKIVGLTMPMKFCLLFFCFLPRCLLVVILQLAGRPKHRPFCTGRPIIRCSSLSCCIGPLRQSGAFCGPKQHWCTQGKWTKFP